MPGNATFLASAIRLYLLAVADSEGAQKPFVTQKRLNSGQAFSIVKENH
ncbi:MAG: hypothetical protein Q4D73_04480 [Actinomycetaceae bacterium]|nr:hypothetical protein [Actinomycetaceae bacterium]